MRVRVAAIVIGLLAAGTAAAAKEFVAHKPNAKTERAVGHQKAKSKTRLATISNPAAIAVERAGNKHHRKDTRASRRHHKEREAEPAIPLDRDATAPTINFAPDIGWRLIEDPVTGARLGLPEKLVPLAGASRSGSRWTSAQGQIQIETFRLTEAALPALFEQEKKTSRRQIASSQLAPDGFAIRGVQGLKDFVVRAAAHGSEIRGVTILYDQATEGRMERIGAAVASTFTGFPDPQAAAQPGLRRLVEYGTAIVVSSDGDFVAPAHITEDCQSIALPGLGHGERIAADKASDLALIRVYGARNLAPAMLGGGSGGELTLVGVADPLTQAGAADVTSAAARLTAQGIEPSPKLGFSGAAAVDANGGLAGMVDLKPAVVAGNGSVSRTATLVPVETIRGFLQAHGIALAAARRAPMAQSVMRIVCVRE